MISLAFLLGEAWILQACWKGKWEHSLWLVPLFILWSNLHGGFIIGLFYFVLYILGGLLDEVLGRSQPEASGKSKRKRLLIVLMICLMAVMIHPMGYKVWATLSNTMNASTGSGMIVEWSSPDFHDPTQQIYLWWLMTILVLVALSERKTTFVDILSLVAFTIIGFIWRRNLSFLVVFGAILASKHMSGILTTMWEPSLWSSDISPQGKYQNNRGGDGTTGTQDHEMGVHVGHRDNDFRHMVKTLPNHHTGSNRTQREPVVSLCSFDLDSG